MSRLVFDSGGSYYSFQSFIAPRFSELVTLAAAPVEPFFLPHKDCASQGALSFEPAGTSWDVSHLLPKTVLPADLPRKSACRKPRWKTGGRKVPQTSCVEVLHPRKPHVKEGKLGRQH